MAGSRKTTDAVTPAIVWLRQDLRLADNPTLDAATATRRPLILLYVLDDATPGVWRLGSASRWWLHHSLQALAQDVAKRGGALTLRRGKSEAVLPKLVNETGARAVFWNRCYEPHAVARDKRLQEELARTGVDVATHNGALLNEPWTVKSRTGEPYKVYSPFWRAALGLEGRTLLPAPKTLCGFSGNVFSDTLASWKLAPSRPNWPKGFEQEWVPGETGARRAFDLFIGSRLIDYPVNRDLLGIAGTSRLSPHLHFGEMSPQQVRSAVERAIERHPGLERGGEKYLSEIGWREFSAHLLFHWPSLPEQNWRAKFDAFPWRNDIGALEAWQRGRTGYPVVDAAMRELWATGYMHNRARMIAASFLIKHLLIDWREGERWFWDTLVDADLANNAASWQWVAGSGADAAPYFRIFNPVTQGERYDANGAYVRRWLPELAKLPDNLIHKPWAAGDDALRQAGVVLGKTYPHPIVDHDFARRRALDAFAAL